MHPCHIIYAAQGGTLPPPAPGGVACALCGTAHIDPDAPAEVRKSVSDNFNDWGYFTRPTAPHLCPACHFCLTTEWLRRSTFYAQANPPLIERLEGEGMRERVRQRLCDPAYPSTTGAWLLCCIEPGVQAKHISFKARPNIGNKRRVWVQYKDTPLWIDRTVFTNVCQHVTDLLALGFSKSESLSGQYQSYKLARLAPAERLHWQALESWLRLVRGRDAAVMTLADYCAPAKFPATPDTETHATEIPKPPSPIEYDIEAESEQLVNGRLFD